MVLLRKALLFPLSLQSVASASRGNFFGSSASLAAPIAAWYRTAPPPQPAAATAAATAAAILVPKQQLSIDNVKESHVTKNTKYASGAGADPDRDPTGPAADVSSQGNRRHRLDGCAGAVPPWWQGSSRGPFNALAGAVENIGGGLRASARYIFSDVRTETGAVEAFLHRRVTGNAAVIRDIKWHSNLLAFGNFFQPAESSGPAEVVSSGMLALQAENDASVEAVLAVIDSEGWDHVTSKSGVTVMRKFIPAPSSSSSEDEEVSKGFVDAGAAAKFACVKAVGTLDADAVDLYSLFLDNQRVHEYNDNCRELRDLEQLSPDTKVSWAATPRYGPFKARDFVTVVHYRTLDDGTMVVINRPIEHEAARRGKKYVRAEILIATNIMRPNREDPTKTDFISVTHINPGGIVDSKIGAKLVNKLCARAPVNLLTSLEKAANSPPIPRPNKRVAS